MATSVSIAETLLGSRLGESPWPCQLRRVTSQPQSVSARLEAKAARCWWQVSPKRQTRGCTRRKMKHGRER